MEKNIDIAENDAKQYIVVKSAANSTELISAILTILCVCRKSHVFQRSRHTLKGSSIFVGRSCLL